MPFTESTYENAVIQLFESMGYTHIYAPDMGRADFSDPLMGGVLRDALVRINRGLPLEAIGEALSKIRNFEGGSLVEKNRHHPVCQRSAARFDGTQKPRQRGRGRRGCL